MAKVNRLETGEEPERFFDLKHEKTPEVFEDPADYFPFLISFSFAAMIKSFRVIPPAR